MPEFKRSLSQSEIRILKWLQKLLQLAAGRLFPHFTDWFKDKIIPGRPGN